MKRKNSWGTRSIKMMMGVAVAALVFTSCKKLDSDENNLPVSGLMAMNLATDPAPVGFAVSGNIITPAPLEFTSYTGGYVSLYSGQRPVSAYNHLSGQSLATADQMFDADKYYSAFLFGSGSSFEEVVVQDKLDTLSSSTQAFVRYVDGIQTNGAATVTVTMNGTNVINESASYKAVSEFKAVDPGSVTIHVTGSNVDVTRTITLEKQKIYTIILAGKPGETGTYVPQIRFIVNGTADVTTQKVGSVEVLK
jgi:hypothetical protein